MLADIIPTKKLPRSLSTLTYLVPKEIEAKIKVGQLVSAPLRRSFASGLVASLSHQKYPGRFPLKYLRALISEKIIFTPEQVSLFLALSKYYAASAALFVHFSLPKIIKKEWDKLPAQPSSVSRGQNRTQYFWWGTLSEKNKNYRQLIKKNLIHGQILIIVPRISDLQKIIAGLNLDPSDYTLIGSHLSRAAYFDCWQSAMNGNKKIFIGTRSACFFPFTNLRLIIVDNEHSPDHKQYDMTPRYEVRKVCQELARLFRATLIFSSPSPSISCYHEFAPPPPRLARTIETTNLTDELTNKNYTFLSDPLIAAVKNTLAAGQKIFLFVNKKGESHTNTCSDCGHLFNCPECSLPLIKEKSNELVCYYCHHTEDFPPFCPHCGGPNFKTLGLGTEKITKAIKKIFPDTKVVIIDSNQEIKTECLNQAQIIIGTEFALDKIAWPAVGLLGIVNADQLWQHSEFMSSERAYQMLLALLTHIDKNARIIIQTFSPDSTIIRALKENKPDIFYQSELTFRKNFLYPPFVHLVKISSLDKKESRAKEQAQKLYQKISAVANEKFSVTEPLPIMRHKIRGQYKFNIILKLKKIEDLQTIIKLIPSENLIDINPHTLLD
ncbi:MAG TPA: primosomal protein N' [Patescibacteria group bacterium]|nr:primosomal protein N' [Patescibacteria group bacterium]